MVRTAIFDLDGTLADTSGDLIAAANACFETPQLDSGADQRTAFRGGRAMLRLGLERLGQGGDEAQVDRLFPRLLEAYWAHIDVFTVLYPGARAALSALRADGWRLGVCTNKPEAMAVTLLDRLGMSDVFGCVLGADSLPVRKPDARHLLATIEGVGGIAERSFLLGDTETDRDAARNAGVPCALVTFGPDGQDVAALEPEALLAHFDDLGALAGRLVP